MQGRENGEAKLVNKAGNLQYCDTIHEKHCYSSKIKFICLPYTKRRLNGGSW